MRQAIAMDTLEERLRETRLQQLRISQQQRLAMETEEESEARLHRVRVNQQSESRLRQLRVRQ